MVKEIRALVTDDRDRRGRLPWGMVRGGRRAVAKMADNRGDASASRQGCGQACGSDSFGADHAAEAVVVRPRVVGVACNRHRAGGDKPKRELVRANTLDRADGEQDQRRDARDTDTHGTASIALADRADKAAASPLRHLARVSATRLTRPGITSISARSPALRPAELSVSTR